MGCRWRRRAARNRFRCRDPRSRRRDGRRCRRRPAAVSPGRSPRRSPPRGSRHWRARSRHVLAEPREGARQWLERVDMAGRPDHRGGQQRVHTDVRADVDEAVSGPQIALHEDHLVIVGPVAAVDHPRRRPAVGMAAEPYTAAELQVDRSAEPLPCLPGYGARESARAPAAVGGMAGDRRRPPRRAGERLCRRDRVAEPVDPAADLVGAGLEGGAVDDQARGDVGDMLDLDQPVRPERRAGRTRSTMRGQRPKAGASSIAPFSFMHSACTPRLAK